MARVFLTGHTGFVGQNLASKLKDNHSLYLYSRGESLKRPLTTFSPDYIVHCAAEIYQDDKMFDSNVQLTYDLLKNSLLIPYKAFIYIGSSSEYGRKDHPSKEIDFLDPQTMYEATKGCGTLLCQAYARTYNKPIMIARPYSLYGPGEPPHRFIPTILRCLRTGETLNVAPGVHDFIHIDDFISGLQMLMEKPSGGEIYNFGTGVQTSNEEVVQLVERLAKCEIRKKMVGKLRPFDSQCWCADTLKARYLGWKVTKTLAEGLSELI